MRLLGFRYNARKKSSSMVTNVTTSLRIELNFANASYLTEFEPHCKHWVQLFIEAITFKGLDLGFGSYSYFDIIANEQMIKLLIDFWKRITATLPRQLPSAPAEKEHTRIHSRNKSIKNKPQPAFVFHQKQSQS